MLHQDKSAHFPSISSIPGSSAIHVFPAQEDCSKCDISVYIDMNVYCIFIENGDNDCERGDNFKVDKVDICTREFSETMPNKHACILRLKGGTHHSTPHYENCLSDWLESWQKYKIFVNVFDALIIIIRFIYLHYSYYA